jgi:predicted nucleotide-binding protein
MTENLEKHKDLIRTLIQQAEKLPPKDQSAFEKLRKRARMILGSIPEVKEFGSSLLNITVNLPSWEFPFQNIRDEAWKSAVSRLMEPLELALEKLELFGGEKTLEAGLPNAEAQKINPKKVLVVHGRNEKARRAMFDFLRSVGLDPIEWGEGIRATGKGAPYVGEIIDKAFSYAQAVVVLLTGDDIAYTRKEYLKSGDPPHEKKPAPQARTNVIFEAGRAFGTHSDRTILVELAGESTRPFSDIQGRHVVRISNKPDKRKDLIDRLQTAGCEVNIQGKNEWLNCGDFDGAALPFVRKIPGPII